MDMRIARNNGHNQILRGNNFVYLKNISVWPVNDCLWTWRCCKNERLSISRNRKTQSHRSSYIHPHIFTSPSLSLSA